MKVLLQCFIANFMCLYEKSYVHTQRDALEALFLV